jgi:hypothetical protein
MAQKDERRNESRQKVDSPAVLFWEDERGAFEVKGRAVELTAGGAKIRVGASLKPGAIIWCAVPSYGIYTRARVQHSRGLLRPHAGLQFLASGWFAE